MKDHRDNPARVRLPLSAWVLPRRDETGLTPAQVHRLREADRWRHAPPWGQHASFAFFALILATGVLLGAKSLFHLSQSGVASWRPVVAHLCIGLMLWIGARGLYARAKALREDPVGMEVHLERGVCPACTYPLRAVPAGPDGCRVCPECGGAWKLPGTEPRA